MGVQIPHGKGHFWRERVLAHGNLPWLDVGLWRAAGLCASAWSRHSAGYWISRRSDDFARTLLVPLLAPAQREIHHHCSESTGGILEKNITNLFLVNKFVLDFWYIYTLFGCVEWLFAGLYEMYVKILFFVCPEKMGRSPKNKTGITK